MPSRDDPCAAALDGARPGRCTTSLLTCAPRGSRWSVAADVARAAGFSRVLSAGSSARRSSVPVRRSRGRSRRCSGSTPDRRVAGGRAAAGPRPARLLEAFDRGSTRRSPGGPRCHSRSAGDDAHGTRSIGRGWARRDRRASSRIGAADAMIRRANLKLSGRPADQPRGPRCERHGTESIRPRAALATVRADYPLHTREVLAALCSRPRAAAERRRRPSAAARRASSTGCPQRVEISWMRAARRGRNSWISPLERRRPARNVVLARGAARKDRSGGDRLKPAPPGRLRSPQRHAGTGPAIASRCRRSVGSSDASSPVAGSPARVDIAWAPGGT